MKGISFESSIVDITHMCRYIRYEDLWQSLVMLREEVEQ
jgi:hypothetical protein